MIDVIINLHNAAPDDETRILKWRNMPYIYEAGFSQQPVEPEAHHAWFTERLNSPFCKMFIISCGGQAIGQIRFDFQYRRGRSEDNWIVSVYIVKKFTGKGYGSAAIKLACQTMNKFYPGERIVAEFLPQNERSKKAFRKARFRVAGKDKMVYIG